MDRPDSGKDVNNVSHIGSRRRAFSKSQYSVEDEALDQITKEVRQYTYSNSFYLLE